MNYTFTKLDEIGRPAWAAQHPDSTIVGFGRSKIRAIRHLEAGRADRRDTIRSLMGNVPLDAHGDIIAFKRVTA